MSSIARTLRFALHCLPIHASFHVAGIALACAAAAHAAATPQEADSAQNRTAKIDFASCAKPEYPRVDIREGHQGKVTLGFLVDENGRVKDSKVMGSSGFMSLDMAAQTALATCSFHPALANGQPVQQWTKVQYVWTLH